MFKQLTKKLEYLFDNDTQFNLALEPSLVEARSRFVLTENVSHLQNLSYVYNSEVTQENMENLFAQIACYFEVNFLMCKDKTNYKTRFATLYGKKINNLDSWTHLTLPEVPLYKVYKTQAYALLKKFGLKDLDESKKMTSFLFHLTPSCTLVVMTEVAEPWSKLKIETLQQTLMKISFNL
jgi:hypothetical protein